MLDETSSVAQRSGEPGVRGHGPRLREAAAHRMADTAASLGPWWRFRVWARLAGPQAYASRPKGREQVRAIWPHGYRMALSEGDWMERYAASCGRFYQDDLIALLQAELHAGDTFVDVGANIGFVALTAARLVGASGQVIAIEADPDTARRLSGNVALNGLDNVAIHNVALGAEAGAVSLVRSAHHGTNYIGPAVAGAQQVAMVRGDDLVPEGSGSVLVKIDVEGAERLVLEGLRRTLARPQVQVIVEICERQLARFGSTPADVFAFMAAQGYAPHLARLPLIGDRPRLRRLDRPESRDLYDVLFRRG